MISGHLLWIVITSGLIDSFNPCAISLLLIYISLIFTMSKDRKKIFSFGLAYVISIFVTYFLIGISGLKLLEIMGAGSLVTSNLITKIGAVVVLFFAAMNIKEYFFPNAPFSIRIPLKIRAMVSKYAYQTTVLSAIIVGALIGIYEFPCSGAIYLAVISLLSSQTSFFVGLLYLLIYNLMFVLPLVAIFLAATNKITTEKFINLQEKHGRKLHLFLALAMVVLGITILIIIA